MGRVLTTKFGLWIETRSSTGSTLHGSGRAVEKKWDFTSKRKSSQKQ